MKLGVSDFDRLLRQIFSWTALTHRKFFLVNRFLSSMLSMHSVANLAFSRRHASRQSGNENTTPNDWIACESRNFPADRENFTEFVSHFPRHRNSRGVAGFRGSTEDRAEIQPQGSGCIRIRRDRVHRARLLVYG